MHSHHETLDGHSFPLEQYFDKDFLTGVWICVAYEDHLLCTGYICTLS